MPNFSLPANHHVETLTPYSPAVLGRACAVTGEPLRPGDQVVICDAVPGSDPTLVEGWRTLGSCPHCGAGTGLVTAYVPIGWGAPPPPPPPPPAAPPAGRSPLLGVLVALLFIAAAAVAVAAFIFSRRTDDPPVVGQLTDTPPPAATTAPTASATPDAGSPTLPAALPSPPPSKTPEPPTVPLPTPTIAPTLAPPTPTATVDSPVSALVLINPFSDRPIRTLRSEDEIDMSREGLSGINFRADVDSRVESVYFLLDGDRVCSHGACLENNPPYAFAGDITGDYYDDWDWSALLGEHTISIIACTGNDGFGQCFPPAEVRLTLTR